jgi:hypothetical protein
VALHQLDTENADRDITSLIAVLTDTPATSGICMGLVKLGDGVKNLSAAGGVFQLVISVGGQTVQPPQDIPFSAAARAAVWTDPFPVVAGDQVILKISSPNAADTDVDVTAYLFDTTYAQPDAVAGAASGIAIVGSLMAANVTQVNGAAQTATLDTIKAETVLIVEDTGDYTSCILSGAGCSSGHCEGGHGSDSYRYWNRYSCFNSRP